MKYVLFFLLLLSFWSLHAEYGERPLIIPREEWWADEEFNSRESSYWQDILTRRAQVPYVAPSQESIERNQKTNDYLNENFQKHFTTEYTQYYSTDWNFSYSWPLKYTNFVDSIIVHHTASEYADSISGVRDVYRYHSLSRQWWDIGYHYIIGYDWEIFEGKSGGDYVVGAHSKYNNYWSVSISLLWNYNEREVTESQKESLESLVQYLTKLYGINLSNERYYHMNCSWEKCNTFPIETYLDSAIAWHRDTGHTSCPGENLYPIIQEIREKNLENTANFTPILRWETTEKSQKKSDSNEYQTSLIFTYKNLLDWYSQERLIELRSVIDKVIESKKYDTEMIQKLQILKIAALIKMKE